ncbi:C2 domain-containing protein 5 isoform X24 [Peromyscus californicus insignis]|uniref:C2 domain-containing protein 5 isoform X24 n=1 Tax=Peromyscus californicus insignis TaxID=564181 RepID=UPI0022A6D38B|nr:C2 domain-containing protein 5 isoform X24 [Peromyscus californicus insignis]
MPLDSQQPNSHCYWLTTHSELLCVCSHSHLYWIPFNEDPNPNPHSSGPSTPLKNQTYSFSPSKSYSRQSSSSDTDLSLTPKTAPYPQGPGIYLCPSSTPLSCGSLHLKSRLLSESSLTPHHSSLVSPVLRKSVSFSEELFLAASGMGSGSAGKEGGPFKALLRQQTQSALEQRGGSPHRFCRRREFPFLTLTAFPPGLLVHVGGVVSARSVKLLDRIHNPAFVGIMGNTRSYKLLDWNSFNSDEPETRDAWWAEIRQEIKSHAKALGCHAVVGYSESTSICEEVCILSASGTAAVLNPRFLQEGTVEGSLDQRIEENLPVGCGFCHIPYDELNMPFPAHLTYCYNCRKQKVPDVLFTTIDLPTDAVVVGKGCLIQARLCRLKKKAQAEANATAISNLLPFMEYEVHTQLMNKLKLKGMNALFGLRIQITVGENMLMGLASATGVYLAALPTPGGIQIAGKTPNDGSYEQHISHMQKKINDTIARNKELYEINPPEVPEEILGSPIPEPRQRSRLLRSQSESSDEVTELDLSHGKKDAFVLEIDDTDAMEDVHSLLTDVPPPSGFYSCNTEIMPGINNWTSEIQMFTSVRVVRLSSLNLTNQALNKNFNGLCENLLKSLYFKLRSMTPCCLCHVNFTVSLPEDELIQVTVTAVAITFDKNQALQTTKAHVEKSLQRASTDNEELLQFPLELCSDSLPSHAFPATKEHLESASSNSGTPAAQRATSVDYSSFADRCSSWIELIKLKAQTIRRGSIKTTVTVEKASPMGDGNFRNRSAPPCASSTVGVVKMTPLSFIPGAKITKYLGIINMFFIRETTSLREEGGVSGFLHAFIAEVFAMVRAHVAALGGNAVVSYIMKQCVFMENPSKNQGIEGVLVRAVSPSPQRLNKPDALISVSAIHGGNSFISRRLVAGLNANAPQPHMEASQGTVWNSCAEALSGGHPEQLKFVLRSDMLVSTLGRWMQRDPEFEGRLGYRACFKNKPPKIPLIIIFRIGFSKSSLEVKYQGYWEVFKYQILSKCRQPIFKSNHKAAVIIQRSALQTSQLKPCHQTCLH